jgi:prepilin peptidase CpaA
MALFFGIGWLVCVVAAVADLWTGKIPNRLTYPVLAGAPVAHFAVGLYRGLPLADAAWQGLLSVLGIAACGVVPWFMWRKNAIGGGDLKLFAALGGLLLPDFGFETELYVLVVAALVAPLKLAYQGTLLRAVANFFAQLVNPLRPVAKRAPLDPAMASWFRLGPCFAVGSALQMLMHWRAPW